MLSQLRSSRSIQFQDAMQVRKIMWELFELCPTPEAGRDADVKAVEQIILPLGLQHKRALIFQRFCREYIEKEVRPLRS